MRWVLQISSREVRLGGGDPPRMEFMVFSLFFTRRLTSEGRFLRDLIFTSASPTRAITSWRSENDTSSLFCERGICNPFVNLSTL